MLGWLFALPPLAAMPRAKWKTEAAREADHRLSYEWASNPPVVVAGSVMVTREEWDRQPTQEARQALLRAKLENQWQSTLHHIVADIERKRWGVVEYAGNGDEG